MNRRSKSAFGEPEKNGVLMHVVPPTRFLIPYMTCGLKNLKTNCKTKRLKPSKKLIASYTDKNGYFSPKDGMPLLAERYRFLELVGTGQSSVVIKAKDTYQTDEYVSIKVLHKHYKMLGTQEKDFMRRLNQADPYCCSATLRIHNAFMFGEHYCLVFELLCPVSLVHCLQSVRRTPHAPDAISTVTVHILKALGFLHQQNVIHADLKPANLLLKTLGDLSSVKVVDFGNAVHCVEEELSLYYDNYELQTLLYRAPEVVYGVSIGMEVDMWSLGCILAELYLGERLLSANTKTAVLTQLVELLGPLPQEAFMKGKYFGKYSNFCAKTVQTDATLNIMKRLECNNYAFANFIAGCLRYDPRDRLTVAQAAYHPFLAHHYGLAYLLPHANTDFPVGYPTILPTRASYTHCPKVPYMAATHSAAEGSTFDRLRQLHQFSISPDVTSSQHEYSLISPKLEPLVPSELHQQRKVAQVNPVRRTPSPSELGLSTSGQPSATNQRLVSNTYQESVPNVRVRTAFHEVPQATYFANNDSRQDPGTSMRLVNPTSHIVQPSRHSRAQSTASRSVDHSQGGVLHNTLPGGDSNVQESMHSDVVTIDPRVQRHQSHDDIQHLPQHSTISQQRTNLPQNSSQPFECNNVPRRSSVIEETLNTSIYPVDLSVTLLGYHPQQRSAGQVGNVSQTIEVAEATISSLEEEVAEDCKTSEQDFQLEKRLSAEQRSVGDRIAQPKRVRRSLASAFSQVHNDLKQNECVDKSGVKKLQETMVFIKDEQHAVDGEYESSDQEADKAYWDAGLWDNTTEQSQHQTSDHLCNSKDKMVKTYGKNSQPHKDEMCYSTSRVHDTIPYSEMGHKVRRKMSSFSRSSISSTFTGSDLDSGEDDVCHPSLSGQLPKFSSSSTNDSQKQTTSSECKRNVVGNRISSQSCEKTKENRLNVTYDKEEATDIYSFSDDDNTLLYKAQHCKVEKKLHGKVDPKTIFTADSKHNSDEEEDQQTSMLFRFMEIPKKNVKLQSMPSNDKFASCDDVAKNACLKSKSTDEEDITISNCSPIVSKLSEISKCKESCVEENQSAFPDADFNDEALMSKQDLMFKSPPDSYSKCLNIGKSENKSKKQLKNMHDNSSSLSKRLKTGNITSIEKQFTSDSTSKPKKPHFNKSALEETFLTLPSPINSLQGNRQDPKPIHKPSLKPSTVGRSPKTSESSNEVSFITDDECDLDTKHVEKEIEDQNSVASQRISESDNSDSDSSVHKQHVKARSGRRNFIATDCENCSDDSGPTLSPRSSTSKRRRISNNNSIKKSSKSQLNATVQTNHRHKRNRGKSQCIVETQSPEHSSDIFSGKSRNHDSSTSGKVECESKNNKKPQQNTLSRKTSTRNQRKSAFQPVDTTPKQIDEFMPTISIDKPVLKTENQHKCKQRLRYRKRKADDNDEHFSSRVDSKRQNPSNPKTKTPQQRISTKENNQNKNHSTRSKSQHHNSVNSYRRGLRKLPVLCYQEDEDVDLKYLATSESSEYSSPEPVVLLDEDYDKTLTSM